MSEPIKKPTLRFTEAARQASLAARAARKAEPDRFGEQELNVTRAGVKAFTWELRRFGGVLLQRSEGEYSSQAEAETAGTDAFAAMKLEPGLPTFRREYDCER